MIVIDVKESGGIEKALKTLKRKFSQTKVVRELRERTAFTKPSVCKRDTKKKAIYRQQYTNQNPE